MLIPNWVAGGAGNAVVWTWHYDMTFALRNSTTASYLLTEKGS